MTDDDDKPAPDDTRPSSLQSHFLNRLCIENTPVTIYLLNGVRLQGNIAAFDGFTILLRRDGQDQLIYKQAISTVKPRFSITSIDEPRQVQDF
jgi:host factor-I protein